MKKRTLGIFLIMIILMFFFGCSHLLPSGGRTVISPWKGFEEAKTAYQQGSPGKTGIDLKKVGIDIKRGSNIVIRSITEIRAMYILNESVKKEDLDFGVQKCLDAKNRCFAVEINPGNKRNRRIIEEGENNVKGFWKDFFGFKKIRKEEGWHLTGRYLMVLPEGETDEYKAVVVYRERPGGKPREEVISREKNPLGPLHNIGEQSTRKGIDLIE